MIGWKRARSSELAVRLQNAYDKVVQDPAQRSERDDFLHCLVAPSIADLEKAVEGARPKAATAAKLTFLGERPSWNTSNPGDLRDLKEASKALKASASAKANADLIALTDRAILQHQGELADALRPKGTYINYLEVKTETIATIRAEETYQGGPYELFVDEVEAMTLEERFFLTSEQSDSLDTNTALLLGALRIYDVMLAKMADPNSAATERQREYFVNDIRFRAALDALLASEQDKARAYLRDIAESGDTWAPTGNLDHVYVRRFLRLPLDFGTEKSANGVQIDNTGDLNQFYNPRQVALYVCGLSSRAELFKAPYQRLEDALLNFKNFDYRVYLASSSDREELEKMRDHYNDQIAVAINARAAKGGGKADFGGDLVDLATSVDGSGIRATARAGAQTCVERGAAGIDDLAKLTLRLRGNWEDGENPDRTVFGIYFGGNLTFDEATEAAGILRSLLQMKDEPYLARPSING